MQAINDQTLEALKALAEFDRHDSRGSLIATSAVNALLLNEIVDQMQNLGTQLAGIAAAYSPPPPATTVAAGLAHAAVALTHALQRPFDEFQAEITQIHGRLDHHQERMNTLDKAIDLQEVQIGRLQLFQDALPSQLEQFKLRLDGQQTHLQLLETRVGELRAFQAGIVPRIEQLQVSDNHHRAHLERIDIQVGELKSDLNKMVTVLDSLQLRDVSHEERTKVLQGALESLEIRTGELQADRERMAGRLDLLQQRDAATVRQLLRLYGMIAELEGEVEDWETAVQELQRHGEEVGIEVVIVEAEPKARKEKTHRPRRKPHERKR
ncbi:MAG TPA: hypothetical protein VKR31_02565 [Rhizomicrobium sp.]|nr:hypothetical protein [Rhizomicrobium sp.]